MKKILLALATVLSVQFAFAQVKSPAEAQKAVKAAEAAAANPKKATKVATWLKLAGSYMDAYNAPAGNAWLGAGAQELSLIMNGEKPKSDGQVVLNNETYRKSVYSNKNFYFNANGQLAMIEVTKPVIEDALAKALDAYVKADAVDAKKSKTKDVKAGLRKIADAYATEALNQYTFGNLSQSSEFFGRAYAAAATAPLAECDSSILYNAGFTAFFAGEYERALEYFNKCLEINYYYDDGEVFAKLSSIYEKLGRTDESVAILKEGFTKYPQSQSILINLINYYISSGENQNELFELLDKAKANEPNNASLYYVEGNIRSKLGQNEEAIAAYAMASSVNPSYEYGYYGMGVLYCKIGDDLAEKASLEMDDAKYRAIKEESEGNYLKAVEPFEQLYSVARDEEIKLAAAEYLKAIYYRFSSEDDKYMEGYKKYNEIVKASKQ